MASSGNLRKLSIRNLTLLDKRVFIRVDFNVPLEGVTVADDTRIRAALPTIELALEKRAALILASHLGRPKGEPDPELSLRPVAQHLSGLLERPVEFVDASSGDYVRERVMSLLENDIILLENLRFDPREKANDPAFARELASYCDEYVDDAFGTAHRAHASTVGVPRALGRGAAGLLMEKELKYLSRITHDPEPPVVAILGGAKVSDKIDIISNLLDLANTILIGGGMAYTFLKAQGHKVGKSLLEEDKIEAAGKLLEEAKEKDVRIELPVDHVVAAEFSADAETRVIDTLDIPADSVALDIGPQTREKYAEVVAEAKTVFWNGPMGVFEFDSCAEGTFSVARAVADSPCLSVVGGGDSVAAVNRSGLAGRISHISTGGGASLEFVAGKELPGVTALTDA